LQLNNNTKDFRTTKCWRLIKRTIIGSFIISILCLSYFFGFYKGSVSNYRTYNYTKLPNSCFLEALIHSSRASLVLKSETTPQIFTSIFGYTYRYNDEIKIGGKNVSAIFGHAICIFEFKNKLWAYDMNYGTMPIGIAGDREKYNELIALWAEKTYGIKIEKSFVLDDWTVIPN